MKKTIIAGVLAVLGLMIVSCSKEADFSENGARGAGYITATATIEMQATKTDYDDKGSVSIDSQAIDVSWSDNDTFNAYYGDSFASIVGFSTSDGGENFTSDAAVANGTALYAVYGPATIGGTPASPTYNINLSGQASGGGTESISNLYRYDAMVASAATVASNKVKFTFNHKCAFLKVRLHRGSFAIQNANLEKSVSLVFKNCQVISESGINFTGWAPVSNALNLDITLENAIDLNSDRTLYIAIPPIEYVSGEVSYTDSKASYSKVISMTSGQKFEAGKIYDTDIYFAPDNLVANFGTPGGNGAYTSTYSWTQSTSNLMDVFTFSAGELANYTTLTFTFSNLVDGPVRMGYYVGSTFTEFGNGFYSAGTKTVDLTALGIDLATVTKISFGGRSNAGSCVIKPGDVILSGANGSLTASFKTPGNNASYSPYSWTATNNNLMSCFEFANGELANYKTLTFTISNLTSGTMVRMGYYVGSNFTEFGSGYGSNGTKTVDLTALGIDLATVTKISFGGRTGTGSVNIFSSDVILTK